MSNEDGALNSLKNLKVGLTVDKQNFTIIEDEKKTFKKRILQTGIGQAQPALWSEAKVLINLIDDVKVDDLDLGEYRLGVHTDVTVGEGVSEFAELVDEVVQTMKKEEWCYVRTKLRPLERSTHEFNRTPNSIPDMDNEYVGLRFNVQLQSFDSSPDLTKLEPARRVETAERHKSKGNELYNVGRIDMSRRRFLRALDYLKFLDLSVLSENTLNDANRLSCNCHLNLALGYLKQQHYSEVVEHCNSGLALEPDNIKGLFRRSQALIKLGRYAEAKSDLTCAHEKDPSNKEIMKSLKTVEKLC